MQEVFLFNAGTRTQICENIRNLIDQGYEIDSISHTQFTRGCEEKWSGIVVATKVRSIPVEIKED